MKNINIIPNYNEVIINFYIKLNSLLKVLLIDLLIFIKVKQEEFRFD